MTGDTAITFGQVAMIVSVLVPGIGVVLWVVARFAAQRDQFEQRLAAIRLEMARVEKSLADHKLYAAETFATKSGLKESLEHVHKSLDHLADRIDELLKLTAQPAPPRRRPRPGSGEG